MEKQIFTYRAINLQGILIDKIEIMGGIYDARNIFRETWDCYLKIICDETGEIMLSGKVK